MKRWCRETMAVRILVVEDERKLADSIKTYLEAEDFRVSVAGSIGEAKREVSSYKPDLIILDLMLPDGNGMDFCRELRKESDVPVIILTAKSDEVERVLGLETGADDYIAKPFSQRELLARIRAVLRRCSRSPETKKMLRFGGLEIDVDGMQVLLHKQPLSLTPTEFKILVTLASNPGRVFSRLQLMEIALGEYFEGYERSIDTHVSNLRRKLKDDPADPKYIATHYGVGYRFESRNDT